VVDAIFCCWTRYRRQHILSVMPVKAVSVLVNGQRTVMRMIRHETRHRSRRLLFWAVGILVSLRCHLCHVVNEEGAYGWGKDGRMSV